MKIDMPKCERMKTLYCMTYKTKTNKYKLALEPEFAFLDFNSSRDKLAILADGDIRPERKEYNDNSAALAYLNMGKELSEIKASPLLSEEEQEGIILRRFIQEHGFPYLAENATKPYDKREHITVSGGTSMARAMYTTFLS